MADTKILQAILDKISNLEQTTVKGFKEMGERFNKTDARIDTLGMQLANLEDDAPTNEEFGELSERVEKLEKNFASV